MKKRTSKVKDPHGNDQDYQVRKLEVLDRKKLEKEKAEAKAAAKPAISGQSKAKGKGKK